MVRHTCCVVELKSVYILLEDSFSGLANPYLGKVLPIFFVEFLITYSIKFKLKKLFLKVFYHVMI